MVITVFGIENRSDVILITKTVVIGICGSLTGNVGGSIDLAYRNLAKIAKIYGVFSYVGAIVV